MLKLSYGEDDFNPLFFPGLFSVIFATILSHPFDYLQASFQALYIMSPGDIKSIYFPFFSGAKPRPPPEVKLSWIGLLPSLLYNLLWFMVILLWFNFLLPKVY